MIETTTIHKNSNGKVVGKSIPGLFGYTLHKGPNGFYGKTRSGLFNNSKITTYEIDD